MPVSEGSRWAWPAVHRLTPPTCDEVEHHNLQHEAPLKPRLQRPPPAQPCALAGRQRRQRHGLAAACRRGVLCGHVCGAVPPRVRLNLSECLLVDPRRARHVGPRGEVHRGEELCHGLHLHRAVVERVQAGAQAGQLLHL